jgi:hypothetical protein
MYVAPTEDQVQTIKKLVCERNLIHQVSIPEFHQYTQN